MQKIRLAGVGNIPNLRRLLLIDADAVTDVFTPARFVPSSTSGSTSSTSGSELAENQQVEIVDAPLVLDVNLSELEDVQFDIYFVPGEGSFLEKTADGVYSTTLSIPVPGDFRAAADVEYKLKNRKWIGIIEDNNGLPRLVGTHKQPLRFEGEYSSASRSRAFTFYAVTYQAAYYLASTEILTIGGFNDGFDSSFN